MSEIAISITCKIDGETKTFLLENVGESQVNESSTITKHPIPTGDMIADHSFKEPIAMNIDGSFSSTGNRGLVFSNNEFSLIDIQELFSRIKDEGILCTIVKVNVNDNSEPLFTVKKDMCLQSITWTERITSLGYSFSFTQVMTVDIQEFDVDTSDMYLPDVTDPNVLNFTESPLFDVKKIKGQIEQIAKDVDVAKETFIALLASFGKSFLIGAAVGIAVGTMVASSAAATAIATAVATTSATGIGAAVGVAILGAYVLYKVIKTAKEQAGLKVRVYKKYASDKKNKQEMERWENMMNDIVKQFETLNDQIMIYKISASGQQQCLLTINDDYYCFTFTKNNVDESKYTLKVLTLDNQLVATMDNVKDSAIQSLDGCRSDTALMKVEGLQVFLLNPINSNDRTNDLTENYILISRIDMGNFNNILAEAIRNYLVY